MNLSIQDLGALGELVGSVAVIISLAYLAVQIRLNTRSTSVATLQEIQRDWRLINEPADPRTSTAVQKERDNMPLDVNERFYLRSYFLRHLRAYENLWFANRQGHLATELFNGYLGTMPEVLNLGRNRERWARYRDDFFHPDFATFVDELLASGKQTPPDIYQS